MKISIITVVFNSEKTIKDTIQSVLSQRYKHIEYIIIDGKSIDNTLHILEAYKDEIAYFISEPDKGIYDAMNKGILAATGDVIGILNSDDIYASNQVIEKVIKEFIHHPEVDLVYGDLEYVKTEDISRVVRKWKSKQIYSRFFEQANVPPHPALFLSKKVFLAAGLFDLQYHLAADYEFMLRIFKKHHFKSKYIPEVLVKMRLGGVTNKNLQNILKGNKEILLAWKNNGYAVPILLMPLRFLKRIKQYI